MQAAASPGGRRILTGVFWLVVVFLYAPILLLAIFSFNDSRVVSFPFQGFTLTWYQQFLHNAVLLSALRASALVATISSVVTVALGVLAAYPLARYRFRTRGLASGLLLSPLVIPYLVFGIALLILFTAVDDLLKSTLGVYIGLGLHAVIVGHVVVALPYALLTLVPRLSRISEHLEEAAADLGGSGRSVFVRVTLPLLAPAIVSSFLIAFTLSFDEYAIASFLAGDTATYPIFLYGQLRTRAKLPQMIAVSVIVLVLSLVLVAATEAWRQRAERRLGEADASAVPEVS